MARFSNPLNNIKVASPCPANWDEMIGDDRTRFCGQCKLNVFNLSGMTRDEAESLIINTNGRLCVRFFRCADGTILTKDCPVGWAAVKRRMSRVATAVASLAIGILSGLGLNSYFAMPDDERIMGKIAPVKIEMPTVCEAVVTTPMMSTPIMGDLAIKEPNQNPKEFMVGRLSVDNPSRFSTKK
jgi:hypothetical protein